MFVHFIEVFQIKTSGILLREMFVTVDFIIYSNRRCVYNVTFYTLLEYNLFGPADSSPLLLLGITHRIFFGFLDIFRNGSVVSVCRYQYFSLTLILELRMQTSLQR